MLGVSASPDIPVGARVSPISLSANSAETSSVTSTKLSAQVATPIPTINSPAHLKSTDSTLGLDKTVRLHSSNIVDLSRGPSDLVSEINFGVNSTSISNSSDSNLSGNLSGSNSSQVSFSLNLGPLSVAGLVKGTGHGTEAFPRFSSHNAMSEPQSNISPFDHSQANKGQGQEVNQERRNTGAFPSDGVGEDE